MNGRVYDPLLARFGTPDPMTEDPFSTQGWNRYSYVGNSPVNFTDPSGYCFLGCFWKPIFKAIGNFFKENWGAILQIAAAFVCQPVGLGPVCAAATATFVTGVTSGNLGLALRAGVTAFFTAAAMEGIGNITGHTPDFLSSAHLQNIAGHALVGCLSAVMGGAKCGPGALAGAVGSFAAPILRDIFPHPKTNPSHLFGGTVASAIIGGLASVAGGGKFANGAVTAAFGYLFNHALGDYSPPTRSPQFPNSQIPDGPWEWQPDADNGRGGVWRNPEGYTASYDEKLSHWDINPPQDQEGDLLRRRYSNRGVLLDDDEAHRYRGPRLPPIKPRIGPPIILPVSPCVGMPQLCLGPGGT
jgi:hypothetical protein